MKRKHENKSPEEVRYLLNRKGWTFAEVDRTFDLKEGIARQAARYPHVNGELAIAEVLSLSPRQIWPLRFCASTGERLKPQPPENYTPQARALRSQKRRVA